MQCIFINLFLKAKCFVFYSELHVHEKNADHEMCFFCKFILSLSI